MHLLPVLIVNWYVTALIPCGEYNDIGMLEDRSLFLRSVCSDQGQFWLLVLSCATPEFFCISSEPCKWKNDSTLAGSKPSLIISIVIVVSMGSSLGRVVDLDPVSIDDLDLHLNARGSIVEITYIWTFGRRAQVEAGLRLPQEFSRRIKLTWGPEWTVHK